MWADWTGIFLSAFRGFPFSRGRCSGNPWQYYRKREKNDGDLRIKKNQKALWPCCHRPQIVSEPWLSRNSSSTVSHAHIFTKSSISSTSHPHAGKLMTKKGPQSLSKAVSRCVSTCCPLIRSLSYLCNRVCYKRRKRMVTCSARVSGRWWECQRWDLTGNLLCRYLSTWSPLVKATRQ